ncbi:MAG: Maf family protein [Eubacteriales bacterium]
MKKIILASKSPRRHEILNLAGIGHIVVVPEADESTVSCNGDAARYVSELSKLKSDALAVHLKSDEHRTEFDLSDIITVSADTVVVTSKLPHPLGKPKNFDEACEMLRLLSGTHHHVLTGVTIRENPTLSDDEITFVEDTKVFFRSLSEGEITDYVRKTEPYDKAGAYGIQDEACVFVSRIEGDYYNVMGLPVCRLYEELAKLGYKR